MSGPAVRQPGLYARRGGTELPARPGSGTSYLVGADGALERVDGADLDAVLDVRVEASYDGVLVRVLGFDADHAWWRVHRPAQREELAAAGLEPSGGDRQDGWEYRVPVDRLDDWRENVTERTPRGGRP
ncbi:hypothetical protein ACOACO_01585 [Nocardioides sp. CPCC 205120]|uniref:hypothetical protein n=1 Tax=Nocardioides sp. CPCC 205120 TaxID=3406462 RepID=UPI003B5102E3